jgi:hypothetical protein
LLGDLSFLDTAVQRAEAAIPTQALAGVGQSLHDVGEQLVGLDPGALLDAVEQLGPRLEAAFEQAAEAIRREIVALLESLQFASARGSASVSVEVGVG